MNKLFLLFCWANSIIGGKLFINDPVELLNEWKCKLGVIRIHLRNLHHDQDLAEYYKQHNLLKEFYMIWNDFIDNGKALRQSLGVTMNSQLLKDFIKEINKDKETYLSLDLEAEGGIESERYAARLFAHDDQTSDEDSQ